MDLLASQSIEYEPMPVGVVRKKTSWTPPPSPHRKEESGPTTDYRMGNIVPGHAVPSAYTHPMGQDGETHPLLANPVLPPLSTSFQPTSAPLHQFAMDQQFFQNQHAAYTISPDGSFSTSPSPIPFSGFGFQFQQDTHPIPYLPPVADMGHHHPFPSANYMFPGYFSASVADARPFEFIHSDPANHQHQQQHQFHQQQQQQFHQQHQNQQQLHQLHQQIPRPTPSSSISSSICMAPSSLFNNPFVDFNGMASPIQASFLESPPAGSFALPLESATNSPTDGKKSLDCLVSPTSPVPNVFQAQTQEQRVSPGPASTNVNTTRHQARSPVRYNPYISTRPMRQAATSAIAATAALIATTTPSPPTCRSPSPSSDDYKLEADDYDHQDHSYSHSSRGSNSHNAASHSARTQSTASVDTTAVYNKWSPEEDEILRNAVARVTKNNTTDVAGKWVRIAQLVPHRTPIQCSARWSGALNKDITRGKWTTDEDNLLIAAVEHEVTVLETPCADINWQKIAMAVPGRTGVQCAARYQEALDPGIRKGKWLDEEDVLLKEGLMKYGKSWVKIAAGIPNRTQRQCRTRWLQIFPKMKEEDKIRMEALCGSPIAVNEKVKKKKTRR